MGKSNWTKGKIFFLFIIPLSLYISLLPVMPLMEPDEARYSCIPSLMNRTGDYITPHLNHVVYLEKPPLCCQLRLATVSQDGSSIVLKMAPR